LARIDGIGQNTSNRRLIPSFLPSGRGNLAGHQVFGKAEQAMSLFQIVGEHLADDSGLRFFQADALRIARAVGIQAQSIRRACPGQQDAGAILGVTTAPHPFGNQRTFVLRHGATDLQQQLVMRVLAHRAIEELNLTTVAFQFFHQQDLMHILTGEAVGRSDQHALKFGLGGAIPQAIQARTIQRRAAVAIIAKDVFVQELPALRLDMGLEPLQLLLNGLCLSLTLR